MFVKEKINQSFKRSIHGINNFKANLLKIDEGYIDYLKRSYSRLSKFLVTFFITFHNYNIK